MINMEVVHDKRTKLVGRIVFLIAIAFFMGMCQFAGAQEMSIMRQLSYNKFYKKELVSKFPSYGLEIADGKDTIYLSILSDSISPKSYGIRLYAYFPENTDLNRSKIRIGLSDGSEYYLVLNSVDFENRYVEYDLTDELYAKMLKIGVKKVAFNDVMKNYAIDDEYYFMAFLNTHFR